MILKYAFCVFLLALTFGKNEKSSLVAAESAKINTGETIPRTDGQNTTTPISTTTISSTTVAPTTTTIKINTTTTVSTTTSIPITTSAPTTTSPSPDIKSDIWIVSNGDVNCILAKMDIQFTITYNTSNDKPKDVTFKVLSNANSNGSCGQDMNKLILPLMPDGTIDFIFHNTVNNSYSMDYIEINIPVNNSIFINNTWSSNTTLIFTYSKQIFERNINDSYTCEAPNDVKLNCSMTDLNVLKLSNMQVQAFGTTKNKNFGVAIDCITRETPDIVPIAVGLALALLVIVVLIGFLISRRRSQARGYLSM
uniref:Lysosome-associated membrane glycoprotein 5 n=1 Tax=Clastoptera arizonana TaxID=38151 RepID=A0A1B6C202_9HEMI